MASVNGEVEKKQKKGGFIFTWSIHNFSHCNKAEDEWIESPQFMVESLGNVFWNLQICTNGWMCPGFISCFLVKNQECSSSTCVYTFSIYKSNGTFEVTKTEAIHDSDPDNGDGISEMLDHQNLKDYLENDTLTVQCKMWKKGEYDMPLVYCHAHTEIKVTKINYTWTLDDIVGTEEAFKYRFNHSTQVPALMSNMPKTIIHILNGGSSGEDAVYFGVQIPELQRDVFLVCVIHLLDADGKVTHTVRGEQCLEFVRKAEVWKFPIIPKDKLYSDKKLFLVNNKLTLQCDLSFSQNEIAEKIEYGKPSESQIKQTAYCPISTEQEPWNESLKAFYSERKLSNVIVRTPNREFAAHKGFLCAHSEVFCAMFEHDMKEQNSGVIEIEDVEEDIVDKMLKFVYTGNIDDMNCSLAQKLYYAADKYRITSLLKVCSKYMMNRIDVSNVCNILILADMHADEKLKSYAEDFISNHVHEIVNSDNWNNMKDTNSQLTFDTMDWLLKSKFSKC